MLSTADSTVNTKPRLLIAECSRFSPRAISILSESFEVELADLDREGLLQRVAGFNFLWVRLRNLIDAEVMDAAPALRTVITNTTGLNHIDLDHAKRRGIDIVSLRGETKFLHRIRATAEHTIALTLALLRRIPDAHVHACDGQWDRNLFRGSEIYEKTVGIVGYGRLGRIAARYFCAFDASVIIHSLDLTPGTVVDSLPVVGLPQLLADADIVSLHVNYEPENEGLFGKAEFDQMKPDAVFVNTARGELVDENALADALESGKLAGAAIDVVRGEQTHDFAPSRLVQLARNLGNVVLTPHIGGNTHESLAKTELFLAKKLCRMAPCWQPGRRVMPSPDDNV